MGKDAYYFSHDNNARNDPKCSALIGELGFEGYGIYWAIIEILAEQENYKLKKFKKLYCGLAKQLQIDIEKIRSIIEALLHEYELLLQDENYIWSESLLRRMELKEQKRQTKIEAGRKGGLESGVSRKKKKQSEAEAKQNEAQLEANEPKESKVKESKGNKNLKDIYRKIQHLELSQGEYDKLCTKFPKTAVDDVLDEMENYAKLKKNYTSAYLTANNWLKKRQPAQAEIQEKPVRSIQDTYPRYDFEAERRRYEADRKRLGYDI